ncbi:hypothetical protein SARC_11454 [Sphaeroforma arctica JP610]|uniref:Uncharacterized protein n=1 Tax=Sphaeroforma arctica JP610 TaxID=667725 RepID=A0A0L0FH08_9EUKA|nr:hypothetical protein SARC_11454 [Sphaeroforma arctica JP610]KNC76035.1 hypothetical protein SARC_11454 [Sphaeroforma arctica JP610]|eukprot:XP_014149937.1 hypothetical protein SARC_11454 [Sphaeroforma arctica JP610]
MTVPQPIPATKATLESNESYGTKRNITPAAFGEEEGRSKTKTCLLVNHSSKVLNFGTAAERDYLKAVEDGSSENLHCFTHYKMQLFNPREENPEAVALDEHFRLPVRTFVVKSNEYLKDFSLKIIQNQTSLCLQPADVQWVLTIPAIWSDGAKTSMRKAAVDAGLISNVEDTHLLLAYEPASVQLPNYILEAAVLKKEIRYLVLDCGGGTVDVAAYNVYAEKPVELAYDRFKAVHPFEHLNITRQFVLGKEARKFDDFQINVIYLVEFDPHLDLQALKKAYNRKHTNHVTPKGDYRLVIFQKLAESFFEQSIRAIIAHIQLLLKNDKLLGLKYVLLAGGYSTATILRDRLEQLFASMPTQVVHPKTQLPPWWLVPCSLDGIPVVQSKSELLQWAMEYPAHMLEYDHILDKMEAHDTNTPFVKRHQTVKVEKTVTHKNFCPLYPGQKEVEFEIWACLSDKPPISVKDPTMKKVGLVRVECSDDESVDVEFYFGMTNITITAPNPATGATQNTAIEMPLA